MGRSYLAPMMRRCLCMAAVALAACTGPQPPVPRPDPTPVQRVAPQPADDPAYHGGAVAHHAVAYTIFWLPPGRHFEPAGTAAADAAYERRLDRFLQDVGGSPYFALATQYPDRAGAPANSVTLGGAVVDTTAYSQPGTANDPLSDVEVRLEVARVAREQGWVEDVDHVFFVYTALDVVECDGVGYCNGGPTFQFCAYHFDFADVGREAVYAFMGDHALGGGTTGQACGTTPGGRVAVDPADDVTADAQVSVTAHELAESVTDPAGGGWSGGPGGTEIGDKCANRAGPPNRAGADVYLNGDPYSIQMLWSKAVAACAMSVCGTSVCPAAPVFQQVVGAAAGGALTIRVRVGNPSDTDALGGAVVVETLPAGASVVAGSAAPAPSSASGGRLTWDLGAIAVHDGRDITFRVRGTVARGASAQACAQLTWWDMLGDPQPAPLPSCAVTASTR